MCFNFTFNYFILPVFVGSATFSLSLTFMQACSLTTNKVFIRTVVPFYVPRADSGRYIEWREHSPIHSRFQ